MQIYYAVKSQGTRCNRPRSEDPRLNAASSDLVQHDTTRFLVGRAGLEPATLGLRVPCTTSCANGPGPF